MTNLFIIFLMSVTHVVFTSVLSFLLSTHSVYCAVPLLLSIHRVRVRSQLSTFMYSYRAYGGGRGHAASVLFLNVVILLILPPGIYD